MKILDNIKTIGIGLALVISTVTIMSVFFLKPKKKKIDQLNTSIVSLTEAVAKRDTTILLNQNLITSKEKVIVSLQLQAKTDKENFNSQLRQLQNTVALITQRERSKDTLIKNLESGIQVDLVTLIYKDPLIGKKLKLLDSTYTIAWRYGTHL